MNKAKRFQVVSTKPRFQVVTGKTAENQIQAVQLEANTQVALANIELKQAAVQALKEINELIIKSSLEMSLSQKQRQSEAVAAAQHYLQHFMAANKSAETNAALNGLLNLLKEQESSQAEFFKNPLVEKVIDIISTVLM